MLNASGALFAVEHEGHTWGNAKLAQPEPEKAARTRGSPQYRWVQVYQDFLENCKPGEMFSHTVNSQVEADSLRSSLSSRMSHRHGNGSYICTVNKEQGKLTVQFLFVQSTLKQPELAATEVG